VLRQAPVLAQFFIGGDLNFAFRLVSQTGPFHFYFSIRQLHPAGLRSVVADLAAGFAGGARAGDLFGA